MKAKQRAKEASSLVCDCISRHCSHITFGSRGVVWEEVRYIPFGLPVVTMEFDSPSVTLIGCLMPSVAGSNAKLDCRQNGGLSELTSQ